jgi:DNA modification methylase
MIIRKILFLFTNYFINLSFLILNWIINKKKVLINYKHLKLLVKYLLRYLYENKKFTKNLQFLNSHQILIANAI